MIMLHVHVPNMARLGSFLACIFNLHMPPAGSNSGKVEKVNALAFV